MKKHIAIAVLITVFMSGCALLGDLIPQDKKEEAVATVTAEICKRRDDVNLLLGDPKVEAALVELCK